MVCELQAFSGAALSTAGKYPTVKNLAEGQANETAWLDTGCVGCLFSRGYLSRRLDIHLQSHITLHLDAGATIEATSDPAAYDAPEPNEWSQHQDGGHSHWHNSLIWGEGLEDIAISGVGLIDGKGFSRGEGPRGGNKTIALKLCRNVTIRDISILMAGHFGVLDSCRNVHISNCSVNAPYDDAIIVKSTHALGFARAVENLTSQCARPRRRHRPHQAGYGIRRWIQEHRDIEHGVRPLPKLGGWKP
jgi:polygalacturonase